MHPSSMELMRNFRDEHVRKGMRVIDVGSRSVEGGTYRELFESIGCAYTGLDIKDGENVDVVAKDGDFWPVDEDSFDAVICGQCLEHCTQPQFVCCEAFRALKPGGMACFIVPWSGEHHAPPDYWRISHEGMRLIMEGAGFEMLRCQTTDAEPWRDTIGIGRKPA